MAPQRSHAAGERHHAAPASWRAELCVITLLSFVLLVSSILAAIAFRPPRPDAIPPPQPYHPSGQRVQETQTELTVSLAALYREEIVNFTAQGLGRECPVCGGVGGHDAHTCPVCGGAGVVVQHIRTPFGVMQQQAHCHRCGGRGVTFRETCGHCGGGRVVHVDVPIALRLSPGLRDGDAVRLVGAGHHHPDAAAGDLIVVLREAAGGGDEDVVRPGHWRVASSDEAAAGGLPSAATQPRSDDLAAVVGVPLREALLGGWERQLEHPSGRTVTVRGGAGGEPTAPGACITVPGGGMPRRAPGAWRAVTLVASEGSSIMELQDAQANAARAQGGGGGGGAARASLAEAVADAAEAAIEAVAPGALSPGGVLGALRAGGGGAPFGDLHVLVHVELPSEGLSAAQAALVREVFPAPEGSEPPSDGGGGGGSGEWDGEGGDPDL